MGRSGITFFIVPHDVSVFIPAGMDFQHDFYMNIRGGIVCNI